MTPTTCSGSYLRTIEVLTVSQHVLDELRILDDLLHSETSISAPMAASVDAIFRSVRGIQISAPRLTGRTP